MKIRGGLTHIRNRAPFLGGKNHHACKLQTKQSRFSYFISSSSRENSNFKNISELGLFAGVHYVKALFGSKLI